MQSIKQSDPHVLIVNDQQLIRFRLVSTSLPFLPSPLTEIFPTKLQVRHNYFFFF